MPTHTDRIFESELNDLRQKLLTLGGLVEQAISLSVRAWAERNDALATRVIEEDRRVNLMEVEIDELCLRLLALRQPAASDLRFITLALKIVTDLERIGDLAVNVAEMAVKLNAGPPLDGSWDLPQMARIAESMLKEALDSFVARDANRARNVVTRDNDVDELYHTIFRSLLAQMTRQPEVSAKATSLLFIAKHLERIADHATNVAEMVIFFVEGRDVRHPKSRSVD